MKTNANVEFAHVYTDESFNKEHHEAVKFYQKLKREMEAKGEKSTSVILIDDYHPSESLLKIDDFVQSILSRGANVDYYVFESQLTMLLSKALNFLPEEISKKYNKFTEGKLKAPCHLLTYAWYLLRLGMLGKAPQSMLHHVLDSQSIFEAERVVNILPQRFETVENETYKLLKITVSSEDLVSRVHNIYY